MYCLVGNCIWVVVRLLLSFVNFFDLGIFFILLLFLIFILLLFLIFFFLFLEGDLFSGSCVLFCFIVSFSLRVLVLLEGILIDDFIVSCRVFSKFDRFWKYRKKRIKWKWFLCSKRNVFIIIYWIDFDINIWKCTYFLFFIFFLDIGFFIYLLLISCFYIVL